MKYTDLVEFSAAIFALDKRFTLQYVVFHLLEFGFVDLHWRLSWIVAKSNRIAGNVVEAFLTKVVFVGKQGWSRILVFPDVIFAISRNGANGVLVAITTKSLGAVGVLSSATIAQLLHHRVDISLEDFCQL